MRGTHFFWIGITLAIASPLIAQPSQTFYSGAQATGQLVLTGTANLLSLAQTSPPPALPQFLNRTRSGHGVSLLGARPLDTSGPESAQEIGPNTPSARLHPPLLPGTFDNQQIPKAETLAVSLRGNGNAPFRRAESVGVAPNSTSIGFPGLTHADQRDADGGNQFSVEPPSPGVAVGNGYVLEGVNNALQVYTTFGKPLLPVPVTSNQLFGLAEAIDRTTNARGVFPTDMRVFYDPDINRWFVLQWASLNDTRGALLYQSREYLAVSQGPDPTGSYNIYTMDTTNTQNFQCPCLPDYPLLGADRYAFYISSNDFNIAGSSFVDATILVISKASLASGAITPNMYRFEIPFGTGYEFAIQPVTTPPGGSYFAANGELEYFVSTQANLGISSAISIWAMYNTSSIQGSNPNPILIRITTPTLTIVRPAPTTQKPGLLPYGSTLFPPSGILTRIDGGDNRILSASYAGGRLYVTVASALTDDNNLPVVGGAYFILSPTFRGGALDVPVLRQGYIAVNHNNLLRSAIAVNAQGSGAIALTLLGPDYYPSAGFIPLDTFSTASAVQIVAPGTAPEDGFSGYSAGLARWGDNSAAVAAADGSIWMSTEYIPNAPRTQLANWGTFVYEIRP